MIESALFILNEPRVMRISPTLAQEIGLNESIILMQLEFLIRTQGQEHNGRKWYPASFSALSDLWFPFWSPDTIRNALYALREKRLVQVAQLSPDRRDRTLFYALDDVGFASLSSVRVWPLEDQAPPSHVVISPHAPGTATASDVVKLPHAPADSSHVFNKNKSLIREEGDKEAARPPNGGRGSRGKSTRAQSDPENDARAALVRQAIRLETVSGDGKSWLTKGQVIQADEAAWNLVKAWPPDDVIGCWRALKAGQGAAYVPLSWVTYSIQQWINAGRPDRFGGKGNVGVSQRSGASLEGQGQSEYRSRLAAQRERSDRRRQQLPGGSGTRT